MGHFKHVSLLKAPQFYEVPFPQFISDITEICYLAAMIEKDVETVTIPDDYFNSNIFNSFQTFLKNNPNDLVAISSMTGAFNNAMKLAEIAKRHDKYVVMGGYHPSALTEEILKSPLVDAIVIGEGESTLKDLVINGPCKNVKGIAYKENGGIVHTGPRPLISDLDSIPHPLRRIRPMRFGEKGDDYSIDTVFTSRGCPWHCTFCANNLVNQRWRSRNPENVIEELSTLHNPERTNFIKIWDANFLTNIKRVDKICDMMIERGLTNFKLTTETSVSDVIRAEGILHKLRRIGLSEIGIGIESPNAKTLELMNKKNELGDVSKAIDILRKHKIKSHGYLIIGHYSETVEDTRVYPEFARSLGLNKTLFMAMTPYPGTEIFKDYEKEDRIKSFDYDFYNNFCAVVETETMDLKTLKKMHAYCFVKYFRFTTGLKKKGTLKVLIHCLMPFLVIYMVLRMNKAFTNTDMKDAMFEPLEDLIGKEFSTKYRKSITPLNWLKTMTIRFVHSPGRNIDFIIRQEEDMRYLVLKKTYDVGPVKGPVIELDNFIKLSESLFPDNLINVMCKGEIIKNNPSRKFKYILSLMMDKSLQGILKNLFLFLLKVTGKTLFSFSHYTKKLQPATADGKSE
ncbi:MAG: B12-binding domain-containing radical SAM protein [Planctomycetota bacterium]|jgi:magnesium-protoporphyrin IX monomethyl ester (oxidative) cyclase